MSVRDDDPGVPAPDLSQGTGGVWDPNPTDTQPLDATADAGGIARKRRRTVIIAGLVLIAVAALSWWAGRATTTTSALAHASKAPKAPMLTAPVVFKRLGTTLQARGKFAAAGSETISVGTISVPNAESIVTASVIYSGERVGNGSVIAQVAGQPVFLFAGDTPMYRTIEAGESGPDIGQLQHDLASIGYSITDAAGTYGPSTSAALAALYRNDGYTPPSSAPATGRGRRRARLIVVPQASLVFVPELPASVASTKETIGKAIGSPAVTLTYGSFVLDATLTTAQGYLIQPGDHATVTSGRGRPLRGVVSGVKRSVRASKSSATIALHGIPAGARVGSQAVVSIDTQSSTTRTLAVPIGALYASGSGSPYVILANHADQHLAVNVGQTVGGYVPILNPPTQLLPGTRLVLDSSQTNTGGFGGP